MNKDLAFKLSNASGVSGREKEVKEIIKEEIKDYVDEFQEDKIGSLVGIKYGNEKGPKIMLAAHMDEVGFVINRIDENGFLFFSPIGGWWSQVLLGQKVKVINSKGKEFIGVIGSKPPHILPQEERKKVVEIKDMFIDLGAKDLNDIENNNIAVGDMVVPYSIASDMLCEDYVLGKAWDNRIGCLIMIEVMQKLKKHPNDVYAVATVQEEIGLKGAKTSSNLINPDVALALDTGIAGDMPGVLKSEAEAKLGDGPQYTIMDAGMIIHSGLKKYILEIAKKENINLQAEILLGGATDAGSINISNDGVPATCISLATRYLHSHNSIISKKDFDQAVNLIISFIENLDKQKYEELING